MQKLRRLKLTEILSDQSITVIFSGVSKHKTADQSFPFEINRNFFYLTGLNEANMALLIIKSGLTVKEYIFKEIRSPERALWDGELLSVEETSQISKVSTIRNIDLLPHFLKMVTSSTRSAEFGKLETIYLDLETNNLDSQSYKLSNDIKTIHPYLQIKNIHNELAQLRMIKDESEVANLKKAIAITKIGLNHIMKNLKAGIYEYQVQAEYEYILNMNQSKPSFDTIAASGHNATVLHYVKNDSILQDNDLMLFDLGANYQNYASDISRTYPVSGKFSSRQKEFYQIVLKANKESIKMLKPGVTWKEYNDFAKNILAEGLIKLGVISDPNDIGQYYYHSIGHFLGLDVHDVGNYQMPLQPGMIVTVEPGLYISEENIGIRIEDDILITEDGAINLSKDIIKEIDEIEAFMK